MRRFILVDPCLGDHGSHPYHYCLAVLEAADRAGFACEAVVSRRFRRDPGEWPERFGLRPELDVPGYTKYTAFGELDTLAPDGRPRSRLVSPWAARHAERRRCEHVEAVARSLAPIVARAAAGDVVLLATASELDVAGLARAIRAAQAPSAAGWHALFHYPLYRGLGPDFSRQERRIDRVRGLLSGALALAAPVRIHIHVTTAELAAQYARLGVAPVGLLPYPVRAIARAADGAGRPLRIAALGDARPEKGSQRLADVVSRAATDPELAGRVTFVIQSNPGFSDRSWKADDRAVRRSLRRLADMARAAGRGGGPVELLPGPLAGGAYEAELAAADATLLAYDPDRYRFRCSGVLLESLASGAVPIVTGGNAMERVLAAPLRRHVGALLTRSRRLGTDRHGPIRAARARPWRRPIDVDPAATAVVVSPRWPVRGAAALCATPATVSLEVAGVDVAAAVVVPDAEGHGTEVVLPLEAAHRGPVVLRIAPLEPGHELELAEIVLTVIDTGDRPPVGAVGIVLPPASDAVESIVRALREFVRHAGHYVTTAREHAAEAAELFCGTRVVETLLATGTGRERRPAEVRCG